MEPRSTKPTRMTEVAAHPVVAIEIRDQLVRVNGEVVENPDGVEPHQHAVHHVARSVAAALGRPVRATATDANGTMSLVVHADGQVSDLAEVPDGSPMAGSGGELVGDEVLTLEQMLDEGEPAPRPTDDSEHLVERDAVAGAPGQAPRPLFADDPDRGRRQVPGANGTGREWPTSETPRVRAPLADDPAYRPDGPMGAEHPGDAGQRSRLAPGHAPGLEQSSGPDRRPAPPDAGAGIAEQPDPRQGLGAPLREQPETPGAPRSHRAERPERGGPDAYSFLTRHQVQQPAQSGWRGALTRMGMTTAPSERERSERDDVHAISRHWPGPRTIAIVNGKGGSGKSPVTVVMSALFARHGGSGILAWDNNETRGTLGWRTEQGPHQAHVLDLLPHAERLMLPTARSADLAAFVHHQTDDKYDVLRSNPQLLPHQQRLTEADFDAVHQVASKYFRLIFIDSGNDETAPHWLRMIDHADQVVVATTTRPDHAEAGRLLLDALGDRNERSAQLAADAVVIVSQADREEASADEIASGYGGRARAAMTIPYDRAMRAPWLRFGALHAETQRAFLRAAAAVSEGL